MGKERIEYLAETETSFDQILESIPEARFPKGAWYKTRLHDSLEQAGLLSLEDDCLLSRDVQATHAQYLIKKVENKFSLQGRLKKANLEDFPDKFRFITILDSIVPMNLTEAMIKINEFRSELATLINSNPHFWIIGAIEVEIVNMTYMRAAKSMSGDQECRKLELCEMLLNRDVGILFDDDDCYLLIHFHGLLYHNRPSEFEKLRNATVSRKRWSTAPRQVEFTRLSATWRGQPRSVIENAEFLCKYMTKGGTDRLRDRTYMRYKFNYEHQGIDDNTLEDRLEFNNAVIKNNLNIHKPEDFMSWTNRQIVFMSQLTHSMMYELGSKKNRKSGTGHLIALAYKASRVNFK